MWNVVLFSSVFDHGTHAPITLRAISVALMGGSFAIFANLITFAMIGKINERVAESE